MTATATPRLYVLDAMPLLYRGHFVFLKNPRRTSSGLNTSALTAFANTVSQILDAENPTHLAVVFDSRTPTFRHDLFPAYKAQRQKIPEDLRAAIPMAEALLDALRIPALRLDGFEADDVMGTLAARAAAAGWDTVLVSPDKDMAQLVDAHTRLYRPGIRGQSPEILGEAEVCAHWQLRFPSQMVDFLGLAGDSSDNVPGIRGIGEKTALALIQEWGGLDAVLDHADQLKGKMADKVRDGAEMARLSRELCTIRRDVPLEVALEDLKRHTPDPTRLRSVVETYELHQWGRRLTGEDIVPTGTATALSDLSGTPHHYRLVDDAVSLSALADRLAKSTAFGFDTETSGLDLDSAFLVGISFCIEPHEAWYVPISSNPAEAAERLEYFRAVLENANIEKVGHHLKFDLGVLRRAGIRVRGRLRDSLLAAYVLDAGERHGLDHLARRYLNYTPIPITDLIGGKGPSQLNMADLEPVAIRDYAAEDADLAVQLYSKLIPEIERTEATRALHDCEEPLIAVLEKMEYEGIRVDPVVLQDFGRELTRALIDLELQIHDFAGGGFNVASPRQLGDVLFDRLGLPGSTRTPSGQYATGEDVLEKLRSRHPIIDPVLRYRLLSKLKNTYVDTLPQRISSRTGRVHTTFSQALTETGRLSSYNPNLQNIPVRTDQGRRIRAAFVARDDGHVLLSADYSQIELRIMAAFSGDSEMIEAFRRGDDIHRETAARVNDVMPLLVTADMRAQAKMVNFGIIYGISPFGLSQRLGIPRRQAAELIETYFERYPGVRRYMEDTVETARRDGFVRTLLGRRRRLPDIDSRNAASRQSAERNAINTPIQGTAADIIKLAMNAIHQKFNQEGFRARMVLQVHDELLFDVPRAELAAVRSCVIACMSRAVAFSVPLTVETGVGDNWLEAHPG